MLFVITTGLVIGCWDLFIMKFVVSSVFFTMLVNSTQQHICITFIYYYFVFSEDMNF